MEVAFRFESFRILLYGLVVRAGANPQDPKEWSGWNPAVFYPLLVTPPLATSP